MKSFLFLLLTLMFFSRAFGSEAFFESRSKFCDEERKACSPKTADSLANLKALKIQTECEQFFAANSCEEFKQRLPKEQQDEVMSCAPAKFCDGELSAKSFTCVIDGVAAVFSFQSFLGIGAGMAAGGLLGNTVTAAIVSTFPFLAYEASESAKQCDSNLHKKALAVELHNLSLWSHEKPLDPKDANLMKMPCSDLNKFLRSREDALNLKRQQAGFTGSPEEAKAIQSKLSKAYKEVYNQNKCYQPKELPEKLCRTIANLAVVSGGAVAGNRVFGKSKDGKAPAKDTVEKFETKIVPITDPTLLKMAGPIKAKLANRVTTQMESAIDAMRISTTYTKEIEEVIARTPPSASGRTFAKIYEDEHRTVWALQWKPGETTPIHDHADSQVGLHIMKGSIKEEVFPAKGEPYTHDVGMYEGAMLPAPFTHRVFNDGTTDTAISVHVYSPPLHEMNEFEHAGSGIKKTSNWKEH